MHVFGRALAAAAVLVALGVAPALAQDHNLTGGYGGGGISFGALNPGAGGTELTMDAGWLVTVFGEHWMGARRVGVRVHGGFTQRPLQVPEQTRDIATWMVDGTLLLRPLPAIEGRTVAPFLSLGGGIISYGLGTGGEIAYPDANAVYGGDDEVQPTVVGGVGIDVLPRGVSLFGTPLGLRLEVADHVTLRSPFRDLEGGTLGPIHNIRFTAALLGLGWF